MGVIAAGGAGFLLLSGGSSGPKSVAKQFVKNTYRGNEAAIEEKIHPESPYSTTGLMREIATFSSDLAEVEFESVTVVSETESERTVELEYEISVGQSQPQSLTSRVTLRESGGKWLLYSAT